MTVKFKESTQWYKIFHIATPIATTVYYKNVTCSIYEMIHIDQKYRLILTYMNETI